MASVKKILQQDWRDAQFFAQLADKHIRATIESVIFKEGSPRNSVIVRFKKAYTSPPAFALWRPQPLTEMQVPLSLNKTNCDEKVGTFQLPTDTLDVYCLIPRSAKSWVDLSTLPG